MAALVRCVGEADHLLRRAALRYIRNPSSDPNFEVFFTKPWLETFTVSLHNFLTTIFQSVRITPPTHALCFFCSLTELDSR